jgi:hypothetical protein
MIEKTMRRLPNKKKAARGAGAQEASNGSKIS